MKLYAGIDLHSNNSYVAVVDETDKVLYQKRLPNDLDYILQELKPYKEHIEGIVVESTYNGYWLIDGLQEADYKVHLANTTAIAQYNGLKHTDDKSDALWLAHMLRLDILATGYIYPKEQRGLRELLRRRLLLVREQTRSILAIQAMLVRYDNIKLTTAKIKSARNEEKEKLLALIKDVSVRLAAESQLNVLHCVMEQIHKLEQTILKELKDNAQFKLLTEMPGIGPILAMTILLETGNISRFKQAGDFSSYCRCVESKHISNAKKKGENNRKNGNPYLGWAFIEASNYAIRYYEPIKRCYQRKLAKTKRVVALKTIANKLSKACFYVLRDGVEFSMTKAFS
ncbi:IS110-like element ISGsu4 family transposase [soil metagenome]